jgi:hypothetical protein
MAGGDSDLDIWMRQWAAAGRCPGLLRDEPRRSVLQERRQAESKVEDTGELALGAVGMDVLVVSFGQLRATAGLRDLCRADLLHL